MKLRKTRLALAVAAAAVGIGTWFFMTTVPMTRKARVEFVFIGGRGCGNCDEAWSRHVTASRIQSYFRRARFRLENDGGWRRVNVPPLAIDILPVDNPCNPTVRRCRIEISSPPDDDVHASLHVFMEALRTVVEEENQANVFRVAYNEYQEKFCCERTLAELVRKVGNGANLSEEIARVRTRIAELDARIEGLRRSFCEKREDRITDIRIEDLSAEGTMSVSKFGHIAQRTTNDVIRIDGQIVHEGE